MVAPSALVQTQGGECMKDSNEDFEAVEHLVNELRQQLSSNPKELERVLTSVLEVIRKGNVNPQPNQDTLRDPAELERQVEERTVALTEANASLQKANEDLEMQLQEQPEENKRTQAIER